MPTINDYIHVKSITLLPYQQQSINVFHKASSGIIEAPTGRGKTLAIALSIINECQQSKKKPKLLWVTPMRALARDTANQLSDIFTFFYPDISILLRTSDSSSYQKKKARSNKWDIMITTPESCALFSTYQDMIASLSTVSIVVIDEWHVLVHEKRGILFELFLSWLSSFNSSYKRWALSATLASVKDAAHVLSPSSGVSHIKDTFIKQISGDILLPESDDYTFKHLGKHLLPQLIKRIKSVTSCLIFTNTRSQSEQWFQLLLSSGAFDSSELAIHHSAVSSKDRLLAEQGIKTGHVLCIVATSSLDLGVDLEPVDLVIHVGSPKGLARLKQRAGRSGHSPFDTSSIVLIPRNGFEILESVAAINHLSEPVFDEHRALFIHYDILMQHIVNICMGASYTYEDLFNMIMATASFQSLSKKQLQWVIDFCCNEHTLLKAYPEHVKLIKTSSGYITNSSKLIQTSQRFGIGTITSEDHLIVKLKNKRSLGNIEEQFIRQLQPQDTFLFSGHILSVSRIQDDTVFVKKTTHKRPKFTRWFGGNMSYSTQLERYLLTLLDNYHHSISLPYPLAQQFLNWQHDVSIVPKSHECLIELVTIDNCPTVFVFPFCGRAANQALALALTNTISKQFNCSTAMTVNDYGIMIQCDDHVDLSLFDFKLLMNPISIEQLSTESFNKNELVLQEFRQLCFVSGLMYKGMPGRLKTGRYTQSSVRILYDVFKDFDPNNLFLKQAQDIVFHSTIFPQRLKERLTAIANHIIIQRPKHVSPFGYTLYHEQLSAIMNSNEH